MKKICEKKIVFIISNFEVGGAPKILLWLANKSAAIFKSVTIISLNSISLENENQLDEKVKIKSLKIGGRGVVSRLKKTIVLKKHLQRLDDDIICSFVSDANVTTFFATKRNKAKIILAERGDPYTLNKSWKFLTRKAYTNVDHVVFQTKEGKEFYNLDENKATVIANPYFGNYINPYDGEREKTISAAGRLVPEKGFDILINAFSKISDKYPNYKLIIYGEGAERSKLELLVKKLKLETKISFPGYSKNVQQSILRSMMFVLPSRYEGMPNVLIEAMIAGVPTISMDCTPGGPKFLTQNGKRGMLVKLGDVDALASAIVEVIENEKLRETFSNKGLELKEELNPKEIFSLWIKMFKKVGEIK